MWCILKTLISFRALKAAGSMHLRACSPECPFQVDHAHQNLANFVRTLFFILFYFIFFLSEQSSHHPPNPEWCLDWRKFRSFEIAPESEARVTMNRQRFEYHRKVAQKISIGRKNRAEYTTNCKATSKFQTLYSSQNTPDTKQNLPQNGSWTRAWPTSERDRMFQPAHINENTKKEAGIWLQKESAWRIFHSGKWRSYLAHFSISKAQSEPISPRLHTGQLCMRCI